VATDKTGEKPGKSARFCVSGENLMGLLAVNGIAFPLSCVLKARPVKDKTHSYLFESVETGGR